MGSSSCSSPAGSQRLGYSDGARALPHGGILSSRESGGGAAGLKVPSSWDWCCSEPSRGGRRDNAEGGGRESASGSLGKSRSRSERFFLISFLSKTRIFADAPSLLSSYTCSASAT